MSYDVTGHVVDPLTNHVRSAERVEIGHAHCRLVRKRREAATEAGVKTDL